MTAQVQTLRADVRIIVLVSLAHGLSHFFQIATAVVFPLIKDDLGVSYTALGGTVAVYYVVSAVCQTLSGFAVDRFGAQRVLFAGLALATAGALLAGLAQNYAMLIVAAVVGGLGNSVFHPCDFSILNARVNKARLGYAFSWHGIAGYLGYAVAPGYSIAMAASFGWRGALLGAAAIGVAVVAFLLVHREAMYVPAADGHRKAQAGPAPGLKADLGVLFSTPVLMCFAYFIFASVAFVAMQNFGIATLVTLYDITPGVASAGLTAYLLGGAVGIFVGGFVAVHYPRHDVVAIAGVAIAAVFMLVLAAAWMPVSLLPLFLAFVGFFSAGTNPSRDLIVRGSTPPGSTGKVYGFVYSGLDVGSMLLPVFFGWLLDHGHPAAVLYTVVVSLVLTIGTVVQLHRPRTA